MTILTNKGFQFFPLHVEYFANSKCIIFCKGIFLQILELLTNTIHTFHHPHH